LVMANSSSIRRMSAGKTAASSNPVQVLFRPAAGKEPVLTLPAKSPYQVTLLHEMKESDEVRRRF
jgi:hypothetical protein